MLLQGGGLQGSQAQQHSSSSSSEAGDEHCGGGEGTDFTDEEGAPNVKHQNCPVVALQQQHCCTGRLV